MLFQLHRDKNFSREYTLVIKEFRNAGTEQGSRLGDFNGFSRDLETLVSNCKCCYKTKVQRSEPKIASTLPEPPWKNVGTDLFEWSKTLYLLTVDHYFIEIARLRHCIYLLWTTTSLRLQG